LAVTLLMLGHAALVFRAHAGSGGAALLGLGLYTGTLGGFAVGIGVASAWQRHVVTPGARPWHTFAAAWVAALVGLGVGLAVGWGVDHGDGTRRALAVAALAPMVSGGLAGRVAPRVLHRLARGDGAPAPFRSWLGLLALQGALASGLFGALHPLVRFPAALPGEGEATRYVVTALVVTLGLLPLAGYRLTRNLLAGGRISPPVRVSPTPLFLATTVVGLVALGALTWVTAVIPSTMLTWVTLRAVVGVGAGAAGAVAGALHGARAEGISRQHLAPGR
jgi:hypothetical protein